MDTNQGRFVEESSAEKWMKRISVGETIKIKDEECVVVIIEDRRITLELKSATDRMMDESEAEERLQNMRNSILGTGFIGGTPNRK